VVSLCFEALEEIREGARLGSLFQSGDEILKYGGELRISSPFLSVTLISFTSRLSVAISIAICYGSGSITIFRCYLVLF